MKKESTVNDISFVLTSVKRVHNQRSLAQVVRTGGEMRKDDCAYQRSGEKVCNVNARRP